MMKLFKIAQRPILICIGAAIFFPAYLHAEIYTIYSDKGFPPSTASPNIDVFNGGPAGFNGGTMDITPPEGFTSFKTTMTVNSFAGWAFDYGSSHDLSRFQSGELRFWVYSNTSNIEIDIKNNNDPINHNNPINFVELQNLQNPPYNLGSTLNQWVLMRIPLNHPLQPLSNVEFPFVATALSGPCTFYIDDVRYVDTTASPIFKVGLSNISDNTPAGQISWNSVNLPGGWMRADQYVSLEIDPNVMSWGVEIYTDNMSTVDANPIFSGNPATSDPAGLVNTTSTTVRIPIAWNIQADTTTAPTAGEPNTTFIWSYVLDQATPGFNNGAIYETVKNNQGIQFSQTQFGAIQVPPNPIYLEANFSNAIAARTYQTTTLRVEFFQQ